MRQTALLIILGQMGAPIPAQSARWSAVSSIFTRIGAHDAIARGQSTFMVEMSELAHILHYAGPDSFVVLDEIGRGTSTWDGLSVAWATLEHLATRTRARVLFATHYHELTKLAQEVDTVANSHMAVASETRAGAKLRFLYELRPGATNESFGIQVAEMAGLPAPVISRAWNVLEDFETRDAHRDSQKTRDPLEQLSLFAARSSQGQPVQGQPVQAPIAQTPTVSKVDAELGAIDINAMTPLQALTFVAKLKEISKSAHA
jgi:DNA mismatch repair protein MutS